MTFPVDLLTQCWFLAGPTACGKTAASLVLAETINAEIIALDSMTLYRGMDVGTAKATAAEQSRVRHHLIDILEPDQEFSLPQYLTAAEAACRDIIGRGMTPLFVGGTGLYLRGLLRGVFDGPAANWEIRQRLKAESLREQPKSLHDRLREFDPVTAARLHPHDVRRVIRAIEVYELSGQPLSEFHQQEPLPFDQRPRHVYWLAPPRDWLYARIDARVEQMIAAGLIDEVCQLAKRPSPLSHTARQALGYKEVLDWLEADSALLNHNNAQTLKPPDDLVTLIQTRTRQFAKRQHTWFRNLVECRPIPFAGVESPIEIAAAVVRESECSPRWNDE